MTEFEVTCEPCWPKRWRAKVPYKCRTMDSFEAIYADKDEYSLYVIYNKVARSYSPERAMQRALKSAKRYQDRGEARVQRRRDKRRAHEEATKIKTVTL